MRIQPRRRLTLRLLSATLCSAVLLVAALPLFADPRLAALFSDHMVLQQGRALPVWGVADPGEEITVGLNGAVRQARAGPDGRFRVDLPAQEAGGPFTLTVDGKSSVRVRDVLVGEVWVASGQSNMTLPLARASGADAAAALHPRIRLFTVPKATSLAPVASLAASWQPCTPERAGPFSAVAYYFGRRLHEKLGVPIGLIHTSWPGSLGEEWTPLAALQGDPRLASIVDGWQQRAAAWVGGDENPLRADLRLGAIELIAPGRSHPVPVTPASAEAAGARWRFTWEGAPQMSFEWQGGLEPTARLHGELRARDSARLGLDLEADGSPADISRFDAIRLRVAGEGSFRLHTIQPSISDGDDYGSDVVVASPEWRDVTIPIASLNQAGWGRQTPFTAHAVSALVIEPLLGENGARPPGGLYNAMVAPLVPYAIQGAIWYQGEGNAGRARQYRALLPTLIRSWRAAWGQGDLPFLIVQLPNYRSRSTQPQESAWAELREAQAMALQVPDTGLAVTIDVGEAEDVHPANKRPVGERLARWALGTVYGLPGEYSGPLFESMEVEGAATRVRFRHIGTGLITTDHRPLRGFAIAGADRRFVWARAEIEGDTVVVHHPDLARPVAVRYAWADNPDGNLGNREGLPAAPFRTDDWAR
jgi:sialate O-acetylesterase